MDNATYKAADLFFDDIKRVTEYLNMQSEELEDFHNQLVENGSAAVQVLDGNTQWLDDQLGDEETTLNLLDEQLEEIALRTTGHVFCSMMRFEHYVLNQPVGTTAAEAS